MALTVGTLIGPYEITSPLGEGIGLIAGVFLTAIAIGTLAPFGAEKGISAGSLCHCSAPSATILCDRR